MNDIEINQQFEQVLNFVNQTNQSINSYFWANNIRHQNIVIQKLHHRNYNKYRKYWIEVWGRSIKIRRGAGEAKPPRDD